MKVFHQLLSFVTLALAASSFVAAAPMPSIKRADGSLVVPAPSIIPAIWQQIGNAIDSHPYTFTMSLASADMAGLTTRMEQIAAEGSGKWLSDDELKAYATPSADATAAVKSFLTSHGIPDSAVQYSKYGDQVTVTTTVAQTASMFAAQFFNFAVNGQQVARTKEYTIPTTIAPHVMDVSPLANYAQLHHQVAVQSVIPEEEAASMVAREVESEEETGIAKRAQPSSCNTSQVTPQCLKDYYGTTSYARSTGTSKPDVTVMGYIDQYVSQSDLTKFLTTYSPSAKNYKIPITLRNGAVNDANNPGVEAMLDVETVVSQIYPLTTTFVAEGNSQTAGDIFKLTFDDFINNYSASNRPKVISISYGSDEMEFTSAQANAMCSSAQKLTSLGTTITLSSGDFGVSGQKGDTCPPFVPTYPSGCQYILSVGATQSFSPEVMVSTSLAGFYSGAGASNIFPTPSYQSSQVSAYESSIGTQSNSYNQKGRFFPDLAAQGSNYVIIVNGQANRVGGTSASAPLTASILAMVNDERAKAGKGTIGWAQPALYASPLNDISSGGSYGCGSTSLGFAAKSGWDSAAGNGSPMFPAVNKAFGV